MLDWIKKHKHIFVLTCLAVILLLIGIPFIINLLFKFNSNIFVLEAEWTAGDALSYYGAILSFIGTVVLGALALYQNHIIKTEADRKAALLEELERIENMPKFYMRLQVVSGFCGNLKFSINNVSNNIAYDINAYDIKIKDGSKTIWESQDTYSSPVINPQKSLEIQTKSPAIKEKINVVLFANMSCQDKFGRTHEYLLKMNCIYPNDYRETSIIEI